MNSKKHKGSNNVIHSFDYAIKGLLDALREERNLRIHVAFAVLVLLLGVAFKLSRLEMGFLISLIGLVIIMELVNTAIETTVDLVTEEYSALAAMAKNVAAAAVFVSVCIAIIGGYILFFDRLVNLHQIGLAYSFRTGSGNALLIGLTLVFVIVLVLKAFVTPFKLQGGMPSAHSAIAFGLATAILMLSDSGVAVVLGYGLAIMVCQSRVEGNIHSIWEVILGSVLGTLVVASALILLVG
jgi:diacylglycerol kinase (ATP)